MNQPRRELLQGHGFKVELERHGDYLRAHVFDGIDSRDVSIAMWTLLGAQCRRYAMRRLLLVEDLAETVALVEMAPIVQAMIDSGFADIRTAFVDLRDDHARNEEAEIIALERGVTGQVFSNEIEARRWLLYGGD